MTGRLPVCEDAAAIGTRMRELQAERMARIAGCQCPPDGDGGQTHRPGCALEPRPAAMATPSQISLVLAAVERMRARRNPINRIPWLGRWGSGDFHTHSGGTGSRLGLLARSSPGSTNPVPQETVGVSNG